MAAIAAGPLPAGVPTGDESSRGRAGIHCQGHGGNSGCHGDAASPYIANARDGDPADSSHWKGRRAREPAQPVDAERSAGVRFGGRLEDWPDSQVIGVAFTGIAYLAGSTAGE